MKQIRFLILLFVGIFSLYSSNLSAQDCPAPENVQIKISNSTPPVAHIHWTIPAGSNVTGFIFTYSLNGGTPVSITLPLNPTEYDVVLPEDWMQLEINLVSICEGGSTSKSATLKLRNIIILDVVMFGTGGAEAIVCTKPCEGSTHFYYSQGSGLKIAPEEGNNDQAGGAASIDTGAHDGEGNGSGFLETFRNSTFCGCMELNGNNYQDPSIVNACRLSAREFLDPALYNITVCTLIGNRDVIKPSNKLEWSVACAPNPASGQIRIQATDSDDMTLRCSVFDMFGNRLVAPFYFQSNAVIAIDKWDAGVYFVQIADQSGKLKTGRFVKI